MDSTPDESLMRQYQLDNYDAFEDLYWRYHGRVLGYLKLHVRDTNEAEDLLQRVFLKIHQARDTYEVDRPFAPWLFSICRNVMVDSLRRRKTILDGAIDSAPDVVEPRTPHALDGKSLLRELWAGLTEEKRRLLELRFAEGLSFEEISEQLGISPPSARQRVSRLVRSLRSRREEAHE
jgi:RNA polymerase sigma-70 factor (ECF subfamily)